MRGLVDKTVVLTGAAGGIGRAAAAAFAGAGARLHLVDRDPAVEALATELGPAARAHVLDVADAAAVEALAARVAERDGRTDVLINNAGVCRARPAARLQLADWQFHLDVNLWGVVHGVQAFLPGMLERRAGHIINVASMAGLLPFPAVAPYCASKFAVVGLSESLAAELAPQGVRVSLVCPGAVRTGLLDRARRDLAGEAGAGVVRLFERSCTSPEAMAARLLRLAARPRALTPLPGPMWPLWLLQRSSRGGYNRLWGLITAAVLRLRARRAGPGGGP